MVCTGNHESRNIIAADQRLEKKKSRVISAFYLCSGAGQIIIIKGNEIFYWKLQASCDNKREL